PWTSAPCASRDARPRAACRRSCASSGTSSSWPTPPRSGEVAELPRLIALSPGTLAAAGATPFLGALERALGAGLPGLLLREPRLGDRDYLELAARVNALRAAHPGTWFAV